MTCIKSVDLPIGVDEAFALVTQPERLRRWKTVTATVDLRVGGSYRFTIVPGSIAMGTYREIEPGKRIVFGWGWEGEELAPDTSTITITLEPIDGGTKVTLIHEGLTAEQEASHAEGWEHFMNRLVVAATDGDAGPDEWVGLPREFTELSAAESALALLQRVALGLDDPNLPTPCSEFNCGQLVDHVVTSLQQLGGMAGASIDAGSGSAESRIATAGEQALSAWRARGLDGMVQGPFGEMPAAFAASILPVEILLHAWDLAQASGQAIEVHDDLVAYVGKLAEGLVPAGRGRSFAEEVRAHEDASAIDRLAAYAGRTPVNA